MGDEFDRSPLGEPNYVTKWVDLGKKSYQSYATVHRILYPQDRRKLADDVPVAEEDASPQLPQEKFDDPSLDLLALGFTALKLLYSRGLLAVIPKVVLALEATRR
jgi:hypothetical protein